jgi:hypothetical protein
MGRTRLGSLRSAAVSIRGEVQRSRGCPKTGGTSQERTNEPSRSAGAEAVESASSPEMRRRSLLAESDGANDGHEGNVWPAGHRFAGRDFLRSGTSVFFPGPFRKERLPAPESRLICSTVDSSSRKVSRRRLNPTRNICESSDTALSNAPEAMPRSNTLARDGIGFWMTTSSRGPSGCSLLECERLRRTAGRRNSFRICNPNGLPKDRGNVDDVFRV